MNQYPPRKNPMGNLKKVRDTVMGFLYIMVATLMILADRSDYFKQNGYFVFNRTFIYVLATVFIIYGLFRLYRTFFQKNN